MSTLSIVAALWPKPGKTDQLRSDLQALVGPSRSEDGNIRFDLFEDQQAGRFVLVEEWSSHETRTRHHEEGPHIQHFHANGAANIDKTEFAQVLKLVP